MPPRFWPEKEKKNEEKQWSHYAGDALYHEAISGWMEWMVEIMGTMAIIIMTLL
jgi:hypothetical protein